MKLFLVRHGQTTSNVEKIYAGQKDVPLTEQGRRDAEALRPILAPFRFDRVFSSDLSRAVITQQLALPGYTAEQTPLLREYDEGSLIGRTIREVEEEYGDVVLETRDYIRFGGENSEMVCARLQEFLRGLEEDPCDCAVAFAHIGIMNCMLQLVLKADYDRLAAVSANCAINVFEYDGKRWRLLAWNYMGNI